MSTLEKTYLTPWGELTFTEFVEASRRYLQVAIYHVLNEEDEGTRDDVLQNTYIALWQRLEREPNWLGDKPKAFVGKVAQHKAMNRAERQTQHNRHESVLDDDHEGRHVSHTVRGGHSLESRQADIRLDVMAAIQRTADTILTDLSGYRQQDALYALYTLTALDLTHHAAGKLFSICNTRMKRAYDWVRERLQAELPGYAPSTPMRQGLRRRRDALPRERIEDIYAVSAQATADDYRAVRAKLEAIQPDTLAIDLIALEGIQANMSRAHLWRTHGLGKTAMRSAYLRVHRMLAAERDPNIRTLTPVKRRAKPFHYREALNPIIAQVADELLQADQPDLRLVALYAYLCNLPNMKVAQAFNQQETQVRQIRHSIQARIETLSANLPQ